jgi:hypothetical protein
MNNENSSRRRAACLRLALAAMLAAGVICPQRASAQVPARFYWKSLSGGNAVPLIVESMSGNTSPFDPAYMVSTGATFDATMALAGYARTFSLLDRAAMVAIIEPMGRISGDVAEGETTAKQSVRGYGDPTLEFDVNLIGPPAQKRLSDILRYEPKFSLDLIADLTVPVGEYDSEQVLNIGQNRWYGRIGAPIVWQIGPWVPGRRTTLELLPAVWLYDDNNDYVGETLSTDPMYQLDMHLTRDFTESLWGSLDSACYQGGQATIGGHEGEDLDNWGVGFTLGYQINGNTALTFGYKSTVDDSAPGDLQMDGFMVTLVSGWHPIIEGSRRLESAE